MYSVLLVGLGGQSFRADMPGSGNEHKTISFAKAFTEHPEFRVTMVCDTDRAKANEACTYLACAGNTDVANVLMHPVTDYDVIAIATPDPTHYEILKQIAGMEQPPKLVICEKPLCMEVSECQEIPFILMLWQL